MKPKQTEPQPAPIVAGCTCQTLQGKIVILDNGDCPIHNSAAPTVTELAAIVLRIVDTLHLQDGQSKTWKPIRDELEKVINA